MSLRIHLLRSPASLDIGDAEGGIPCRRHRKRSMDLHSDPLHFFHCRGSQGKFIRRHDHIRDALHNMIGVAVRDDTANNIAVMIEPPLVCLISAPDPSVSAPEIPCRGDWLRSQETPQNSVLGIFFCVVLGILCSTLKI
jgi:hypothetical protein